jgi:glutamate synthase domain-containing protein 1
MKLLLKRSQHCATWNTAAHLVLNQIAVIGAGILIRVPDAYFQAVVDFKLPAANAYATGIAFIAKGADVKSQIAKIADEEGLVVLGLARSSD